MPRRSQLYRVPRDWLAQGDWPTGRFYADTPDVVAYAAAISASLAEAIAGRTKSGVSSAAAIERTTLYDILSGRSWPDTVSLAKLELLLDVRIWPRESPTELPRVRRKRPAP